MAAFRDRTTTGRRCLYGTSHHQISPRCGNPFTPSGRFQKLGQVAPFILGVERDIIEHLVRAVDLGSSVLGAEGGQRPVHQGGVR